MRTIDKYHNQNDEFVHPLWLGIFILFIVITIIGTLCCLRIKCGSQLRHLLKRLFGRNNETNDNSSNDERYNWPPMYALTRNQSPKLYTLVQNIRTANLQRQLSVRQHSHDDENQLEINFTNQFDHLTRISISPSTGTIRNSEIARKFYASMRNTSQGRNSSSVDSYNNDVSSASNTLSPNFDQPIKSNREGNIKFFRTPRFFQTIPNQDTLVIDL